jgi:hypothetical protein
MNVPVEHIGLSGLTVGELIETLNQKTTTDRCGRVWPGLKSVLQEAKDKNTPFSHVLILAGTNDLASERYGFRNHEDILKVENLAEIADSMSSISIARTSLLRISAQDLLRLHRTVQDQVGSHRTSTK